MGAVENRDGETFRFHVEREIFAHDGETDESNITLLRGHIAYACRGAGHHSPRYIRPWQFRFGKFRSRSDPLQFPDHAFDVHSGAVIDFWGIVRGIEDGLRDRGDQLRSPSSRWPSIK